MATRLSVRSASKKTPQLHPRDDRRSLKIFLKETGTRFLSGPRHPLTCAPVLSSAPPLFCSALESVSLCLYEHTDHLHQSCAPACIRAPDASASLFDQSFGQISEKAAPQVRDDLLPVVSQDHSLHPMLTH